MLRIPFNIVKLLLSRIFARKTHFIFIYIWGEGFIIKIYMISEDVIASVADTVENGKTSFRKRNSNIPKCQAEIVKSEDRKDHKNIFNIFIIN